MLETICLISYISVFFTYFNYLLTIMCVYVHLLCEQVLSSVQCVHVWLGQSKFIYDLFSVETLHCSVSLMHPSAAVLNRLGFLSPPPTIGTARGILFSSVFVSLCILKTLWTQYLKNQWRKFHPVLVTDVFGFVDALIRFGGQKVRSKVKVTAGNDP